MNKKGKANVLVILAVVTFMVGVGGLLYYMFGTPAPEPQLSVGGGGQVGQQNAGLIDCPSTNYVPAGARYQDTLAASTTFLAPTVYFKPQTSGQPRVTANTLATDGTYSTGVNLNCNPNGITYQAVAVTSAGLAHSAVGDSFTVQTGTIQKTLQGKKYGDLIVRVLDLQGGSSDYFAVYDENEAVNTTTTYHSFLTNGTSTYVAAWDTADLTIGSGGYIDARFQIKANETYAMWGETGLNTWFSVDAGPAKWNKPVVQMGASSITESKSAMKDSDKRYYSDYEYAYNLGQIGGGTAKDVDFHLDTAAGVNPASTDAPVVAFCSEGRYASSLITDEVNVGCWSDATTQVQVGTAANMKMSFVVS